MFVVSHRQIKKLERVESMALHESGENYLEAILILEIEHGNVRSIDVANFLDVSKPSVSRAVSILRMNEYLEMHDDGRLVLTQKGREVALTMYERHELISAYFEALGVPHDIAARDACRVEHVISSETFECIRRHSEKVITNTTE